MKKTFYGLYLLWLGIQLKTFRKKNIRLQMKFLQAAVKYSSMLLLLTLLLAACITPGSDTASTSSTEEDKNKEIHSPGNWRSGLYTPTPPPTEQPTNQTSNQNNNTPEMVPEGIPIINWNFKDPDLACDHAGCAVVNRREFTTETSDDLSGWNINNGLVNIAKRQGLDYQWIELHDSEVSQTLGVRKFSEYKVRINKAMGCQSSGKLTLKWEGQEAKEVNITGVDWTGLETIYENQQRETIKFGLEASSSTCPILIKDVSVTLLGDIEVAREITEAEILDDDSYLVPNGDFENPEVLNPKRVATLPEWTVEGDPSGFPVVVREKDNQYLKLYNPITQELESVSGSVYNLSLTVRKPNTEGSNCRVAYSINEEETQETLEATSTYWEVRNQVIEVDSGISKLSLATPPGSFCDIDNIKFTYLRDINNNVVVPTPTPEPLINGNNSILPIPTPTPSPQVEATPEPTPIVEVTPVPTSTPVTSSKYSVEGSDSVTSTHMTFSIGPTVLNNDVSFTGTVLDKVEPTLIQIWALSGDSGAVLSDATYKPEECSTEKPIIFFRKPLDSTSVYNNTSTNINWDYCINGSTTTSEITIPYEDASTWTFNTVNGVFTFAGDKSAGSINEWPSQPGTHAYIITIIDSEGLVIRTEEVK